MVRDANVAFNHLLSVHKVQHELQISSSRGIVRSEKTYATAKS